MTPARHVPLLLALVAVLFLAACTEPIISPPPPVDEGDVDEEPEVPPVSEDAAEHLFSKGLEQFEIIQSVVVTDEAIFAGGKLHEPTRRSVVRLDPDGSVVQTIPYPEGLVSYPHGGYQVTPGPDNTVYVPYQIGDTVYIRHLASNGEPVPGWEEPFTFTLKKFGIKEIYAASDGSLYIKATDTAWVPSPVVNAPTKIIRVDAERRVDWITEVEVPRRTAYHTDPDDPTSDVIETTTVGSVITVSLGGLDLVAVIHSLPGQHDVLAASILDASTGRLLTEDPVPFFGGVEKHVLVDADATPNGDLIVLLGPDASQGWPEDGSDFDFILARIATEDAIRQVQDGHEVDAFTHVTAGSLDRNDYPSNVLAIDDEHIVVSGQTPTKPGTTGWIEGNDQINFLATYNGSLSLQWVTLFGDRNLGWPHLYGLDYHAEHGYVLAGAQDTDSSEYWMTGFVSRLLPPAR